MAAISADVKDDGKPWLLVRELEQWNLYSLTGADSQGINTYEKQLSPFSPFYYCPFSFVTLPLNNYLAVFLWWISDDYWLTCKENTLWSRCFKVFFMLWHYPFMNTNGCSICSFTAYVIAMCLTDLSSVESSDGGWGKCWRVCAAQSTVNWFWQVKSTKRAGRNILTSDWAL